MTSVTVVIPTYREPGIGSLIKQVSSVLEPICDEGYEIIVVDDTPDDSTMKAALSAMRNESRDFLRVLHRPTSRGAWGGLSGAVIDGYRIAQNDVIVVMDGDGQHPAETLTSMIHMAECADMVIASRYCGPEGNAAGLDGGVRRMVSSSSTALARGLFPKRVGRRTTDPMTGFFLVHRSVLDMHSITKHAIGFKILLAILATHPDLRVAEVPFTFAEREEGESKASMRNGVAFLRQIAKLRVAA